MGMHLNLMFLMLINEQMNRPTHLPRLILGLGLPPYQSDPDSQLCAPALAQRLSPHHLARFVSEQPTPAAPDLTPAALLSADPSELPMVSMDFALSSRVPPAQWSAALAFLCLFMSGTDSANQFREAARSRSRGRARRCRWRPTRSARRTSSRRTWQPVPHQRRARFVSQRPRLLRRGRSR